MHRRNEARETCLENVIGRAVLQRFYGHFFAHGASDEDERCLRTFLTGKNQRFIAIEAGQRIIREDKGGGMQFQFVQKFLFAIDADHGEVQSAFSQGESGQFSIGCIVFQHQNMQVFFHTRALNAKIYYVFRV